MALDCLSVNRFGARSKSDHALAAGAEAAVRINLLSEERPLLNQLLVDK